MSGREDPVVLLLLSEKGCVRSLAKQVAQITGKRGLQITLVPLRTMPHMPGLYPRMIVLVA